MKRALTLVIMMILFFLTAERLHKSRLSGFRKSQ